ncbi:MAG TPA: hypothetical protein GX707_13890 [Epulopiscium sp.]|nr:hypothetical protein [Candidatus Epulonipiscium sp.]
MLINEKNKIRVFTYGSMFLALGLGIYGQSISYYLDKNILENLAVYWLTIITIISISLFTIPAILAYRLNKKQKMKKEEFKLYFVINLVVGIMTSLWSLMVLIMWWG